MLVIRLARTGRKKYPTYRVVVADSRRPATGKFVDNLGHYNPHTKDVVLNKEEVAKHLKNGAQPSDSVIKLLQREKVDLPKWVALKERAPRPPKKEPAPSADKPPAPDKEAEAPAAPEGKERVAQAAAANAAEVDTPAQDSAELTETAADGEQQAEAAAKGQKAATDAAVEAAEEPKKDPA